MRASLIEHQQIEPSRHILGKVVKKKLEQAGIKARQFEKKAFARQRLDAAIEGEALALVLIGRTWFDTAQRQPTAQHCNQSEATLVLCPDANLLLRPGQLIEGGRRY